MDLLATPEVLQVLVAASVGYALYITFFKDKPGEGRRMQQVYAAKQIVKQRSERWSI